MAAEFDIKPHDQMWHDFTKLMTFGAVAVVLSLIFLALILLP